MLNAANIGKQRLLFGTYATRRFCRILGITNDPTTVLQAFRYPTAEEAVFAMVQAGIESDHAERNKPFALTEFQVAEFVDELNASPGEATQVTNAFIGSIINKPTAEVPAWIEEVERQASEQAEAEATEKKALSSPSPAGATSSEEPTQPD